MAFGKRPGDYGMSWRVLEILQIFPRVEDFYVFFGSYMNFIGSSLKQKVLVGKVLNILKEDLTCFFVVGDP